MYNKNNKKMIYILQYLPEAKGCSLLTSALATTDNKRPSEQIVLSTNRQILDTVGFPYVIVPVLSNTTYLTYSEIKFML